jgi:hypothetical protein
LTTDTLRSNAAYIKKLCVDQLTVDGERLSQVMIGSVNLTVEDPGESETIFPAFPVGRLVTSLAIPGTTSFDLSYCQYIAEPTRLHSFNVLSDLDGRAGPHTMTVTIFTGLTVGTLAASILSLTVTTAAPFNSMIDTLDLPAGTLLAVQLTCSEQIEFANVTWTFEELAL